MNNKREYTIICWNKINNIPEMIQNLPHDLDSSFTIFYKNGLEHLDIENANHLDMPAEIDIMAKAKNYVINHFKAENKITWLHMLEDCLEFTKSPEQFIHDIENMMTVMDINSWLNTTTDVCNRVFKKYNPRLRIKIDQPEFQKLNIDEILFCSHSNTQWMIFNIEKADDEELHFREDFKIAMYWIIEYLARRRNTHPDSMYFMNQYITCKSEENLFRNKVMNSSDEPINTEDEAKQMQIEDGMFKALNVNYNPDNNIDEVLKRTLLKLRSKI